MPRSILDFFSSELFMPHGHCYLWKPALVWLQVLSNGAIGMAYVAIFATLVYMVRRIRDIPFQWMYVAFAVFIVTCGITHFFDVYVIWHPVYWLDGSVRAVTAMASVGTALLLPPLVPKAIALAEAAAVSHERGIQLEHANRELSVLLDKSREVEQLKTQFFANVSHELRTPLALILGPTEKLLAAEDLSGSHKRELEVVARNARSLLKHVNDLLEISRLEAGKTQPDYVAVDLARLMRRVAGDFDGIGRERAIEFRVDAPPSLPLEADAEKLQRVLLNLLSNAFKHTPPGGHIRCAAWVRGEVCTIEVADSGPGVPPDQREVIFERFQQVEGGSTRRFGGTGLGLAIARDFVALHGGTIRVTNAPEGGALFVVELPLKAPSGVSVRPREEAAEPSSEAFVRETSAALQARDDMADQAADEGAAGAAVPRVLVVEDNPDMNRFVQDSLAETYRVDTAFDGAQGLSKAQASPPDLILTDVMMPVLSGDQLVVQARQDRRLDGVPIVLLTAKADDELRVDMLEQGAQDYLMKPFSVAELRARVGNLVAMKRARDVLQWELDVQSRDLEALAQQVTARKRELETALQSLRVARDQAERASQLKSTFLGMVSHELRTPLAAFQLQMARLMRTHDATFTPAQQEVLQRMSASASRLNELVESLLQYARIEAGRLFTQVRRFDPRELAADAVAELREHATAKGLALETHAPEELSLLESDPVLFRLIVVNLVMNALKFTQHGKVEVTLVETAEGHQLRVSDTGPGIPLEERVRIFEPFQHVEPLRHKHTPGVGLGLTLVREMALALGGSIDVESRVGEGTCFTVSFPKAKSAVA